MILYYKNRVWEVNANSNTPNYVELSLLLWITILLAFVEIDEVFAILFALKNITFGLRNSAVVGLEISAIVL